MTIGNRMRTVRKHYRFRQAEVASALSITEQTLSRYETGDRIPDALLIQKFVQLYNVDANWLMHGIGSPFLEDGRGTSTPDNIAVLNRVLKDEEVREMIQLMEISQVKRSMLAELDKLRITFKSLIDDFKQRKRLKDIQKEGNGK
jgi:transcriptional regulator with XRE-family HTH domain